MTLLTRTTSVLAIVAHVALAFGLGPCRCTPDPSQGVEACCCGPHEAGACPMGKSGGTCHEPAEGKEQETSKPAPNCVMPLSGVGVVEPVSAQLLVSAPPPPIEVAFLLAVAEMSPPRETASPPPTPSPPRWSSPVLLKSTVLRV